MTLFLLEDGRVVGGGIQPCLGRQGFKLTGKPAEGPVQMVRNDIGQVEFRHPYGPPTKEELFEWNTDFACWRELDGDKIGKTPVDEVTVLSVIPVCAECEKPEAVALYKDDYLCLSCRKEQECVA